MYRGNLCYGLWDEGLNPQHIAGILTPVQVTDMRLRTSPVLLNVPLKRSRIKATLWDHFLR